jgi:hypothetical protein
LQRYNFFQTEDLFISAIFSIRFGTMYVMGNSAEGVWLYFPGLGISPARLRYYYPGLGIEAARLRETFPKVV